MSGTDTATIARIDERTINLVESLKKHIDEDNSRFERVFSFLRDHFDKIDLRFDKVEEKMGGMWDERNVTKGALTMGRWWLASIFGGGGAILGAVGMFFGH